MKTSRVTAIGFAAIILEAFINEEYSKHEETSGKKFAKWGALMKWRRLPTLLGGDDFVEKEEPFITYLELVNVRDQHLFHLQPGKSRKQAKAGQVPNLRDLLENQNLAGRYVECVKDMIEKLSVLTKSRVRVPEFLYRPPATYHVWSSCTTPIG